MLRSCTAVLFSLAALSLAFAAPSVRQGSNTIVDVAKGNDDFQILVSLVEAAGLGGALSAPGPLTVLAPTDAAFAQTAQDLGLPAEDAKDEAKVGEFLTTGIGALGKVAGADLKTAVGGILTYHVAAGKLDSTAVGQVSQITTLAGGNITVEGTTLVDAAPALPDPNLVTTDIEASNGIIHSIDRVLFPVPVNKEAVQAAVAAQSGSSTAPTTTADSSNTTATTTAASTTTAETTAATSESEDDDDSPCFPATATVHLADGTDKAMHSLSGGDIIRHSTGSSDAHSQVYLFSHKVRTGLRDFVRIESKAGHAITLTKKHYIYANGRLTAAGAVRVGDKLSTLDGPTVVSAVRGIKAEGLYAPHTMHGDIVVDRVLASTYTQSVHPSVAHYLLAPVRALARMGVTEPLGELLYEGADNVAAWAPKGRVVY